MVKLASPKKEVTQEELEAQLDAELANPDAVEDTKETTVSTNPTTSDDKVAVAYDPRLFEEVSGADLKAEDIILTHQKNFAKVYDSENIRLPSGNFVSVHKKQVYLRKKK